MAGQSTPCAQTLARHVKAALLHLRQAEDLAELAGVDIHASEHDVPAAGLIRAASNAVEDLDTWAIGNARSHSAAPEASPLSADACRRSRLPTEPAARAQRRCARR